MNFKKKIIFSIIIISFISTIFMLIINSFIPNNQITNVLISIGVSIFVATLLQFIFDCLAAKEQKEKIKLERNKVLKKIHDYIKTFILQSFLDYEIKNGKIKKEMYKNLKSKLIELFEQYCEYIDELLKRITPEGMDKAFVLKKLVERLKNVIHDIINDDYYKINNIFTHEEFELLDKFYESIEKINPPYLDEINYDKNIAHLTINYPKSSINDIVKNNYKIYLNDFIRYLNDVIEYFDELSDLKEL